jgi:UDP-glucose 4-epimerase
MEWRGYRVFNIGSGTSHSVEELIECIQKVWRLNCPSYPLTSDGGEIMDTIADISRRDSNFAGSRVLR